MKILKKTLGFRIFFDSTTLFLHYIDFQHIFKHLSCQTGYRYVYDKWLIEKARPRVSRNVLYIYLWKRWKLKWSPSSILLLRYIRACVYFCLLFIRCFNVVEPDEISFPVGQSNWKKKIQNFKILQNFKNFIIFQNFHHISKI